jgi:hypothetical protein
MDDISYTDLIHEEIFMGFKIEVWKWKHPVLDHLCGYVFLPEGHLFHGKDDDEINNIRYKKNGIHLMYELTYSGLTDNGYWKIGFDTANRHSMSEEERAKKTSLENAINELKALVRWL